MRRIILLSSLLLTCTAAFSQTAGLPSTFNREKQLRKIKALQHAADLANNPSKTTGTGQRLVAESYYDYASAQLGDSLRMKYSGTRTSAFDFDDLFYNYDYYYPAPGTPFVYFDTVRRFDPPGSSTSSVAALMTYNGAGGVTRYEYMDGMYGNRTIYSYDAGGKVTQALSLDYDGSTMTWDSSYRDFYAYNSQGRLVRDSSESYDLNNAFWEPDATTVYINNSAGYPTKASSLVNFGMGYITVFEFNITYNAANKPTLLIGKGLGTSTTLENLFKDTIGYTSGKKVYQDSYSWDDVSSTWVLYHDDRRRLNAAQLPDSVVQREIDMSGTMITVRKLAYNGAGLPVTQRTYYNMPPTTPDDEQRYYYQAYDLGIADRPSTATLSLYPNPATDAVRIKTFEGAKGSITYAIINSGGQTVQVLRPAGLGSDASLSVAGLSPGIYWIVAQDESGLRASAQFVKR